ncbi:sensor histidine kinase [Cellulomonas sp. HZM]|uniref:sensor histidine kinase n=1 Tax=Cellulomonas sp. HZM TaxID=1454010 RepID=UPI0005566739|nr:sensor histidine kinase [Cellulomonas sp. HZM]
MNLVAPERPAPARGGFFSSRTWRELGYLWVVLLLSPFALAYVILVPSLAAALVVTVVGLVVVGWLVVGARWCGGLYRGLAANLLGDQVATPPPFVRRGSFFRTLGALLTDAAGWRALAYMFISFPLAILAAVTSTTFLATGLGAATHWLWSRWLPLQEASDGTMHRGASFGTSYFVDTPWRQAGLAAVGVVLLLVVWPPLTHGFARLFAALTRGLLGPTAGSLRVEELRRSRAASVEDADARLRRIERDLHDGTQARLVAVAMQLGEAREQLAAGGDPAVAAQIVDAAHASAKDALGELREIARGIHPAALDAGLAVALETLAARAPLPVELDLDASVGAPGAVAPAVASVAYYTVAELVTNAAKHSGARRVGVRARVSDDVLRMSVDDDGRGGAVVVAAADRDEAGARTGLAGLETRVRGVDGTFDVASPAGGPTVVTVTLPARTTS